MQVLTLKNKAKVLLVKFNDFEKSKGKADR